IPDAVRPRRRPGSADGDTWLTVRVFASGRSFTTRGKAITAPAAESIDSTRPIRNRLRVSATPCTRACQSSVVRLFIASDIEREIQLVRGQELWRKRIARKIWGVVRRQRSLGARAALLHRVRGSAQARRHVPQLDRAGAPDARPSDSQPARYELSNRTSALWPTSSEPLPSSIGGSDGCPPLSLSSLLARADAG